MDDSAIRHAVADLTLHTPRRTALRIIGPLGVALASVVGLDALSASAKNKNTHTHAAKK